MKEIFRDVLGYEGIYQVSNKGRVKSLERKAPHRYGFRLVKEKFLKLAKGNNGYFVVNLYKDGVVKTRSIHQLVAESFLNHTPCGFKLVVNHINFNKLDNRVENLEIVTARENTNQKHIKSTSKYTGVNWHKPSKKWRAAIKINGKDKHLGLFTNEVDAANAYKKELIKINN